MVRRELIAGLSLSGLSLTGLALTGLALPVGAQEPARPASPAPRPLPPIADPALPMTVLAEGLQFPEGPLPMRDGSLLFVEIRRKTVSRLGADGKVSVVAQLEGGPNGLEVGPDGAVYIANDGGRFGFVERDGVTFPGAPPPGFTGGGSIQRLDVRTGAVTTVFDSFQGKPLIAPDDLVFDLAMAAAYGEHPLGRPILGRVESLAPARRPALSAFHQALYAPDRLVVSAAGAVDEDELLRLAEGLFGDMPAHAGPPLPTPPDFRGEHVRERRKLEQAHLVLMLPGVQRRHPDLYAQGAFIEILGGGMSSRLFQEAREARGLAYAIDAYEDTYDDVGIVGVYAGVAAGKAAQTARLSAEILKALTVDATPGELARAKAQVRAGYFMRREQPLARAEQNAAQVLFFDRLVPTVEVASHIDAVGLDDLRRVGERLVSAGQSASAVLGPARAVDAGRAFAEALAAG